MFGVTVCIKVVSVFQGQIFGVENRQDPNVNGGEEQQVAERQERSNRQKQADSGC